MGIMSDLYYGNISGAQRDPSFKSQYEDCLIRIGQLEDRLRSHLKSDDLELFCSYSKENVHYHTIAEEDAFSYGLRLGLLIMTDLINHEIDN